MSDTKKNKKTKRVIACSFLAVGLVIGYYELKFSTLSKESTEKVVVATKDIFEGDELNASNTELIPREKTSLVDGHYLSLYDVNGSVATARIRKNEQVIETDIVTRSEWDNKDLVLASIKAKDENSDTFVAYEVKPFDNVDILYFDADGVYEGTPFIENQVVYDIKTADGISYKNRMEGFVPTFATMWVTSEQAETIYKRQEEGGSFKFVLHRKRSDIDTSTQTTITGQ